MRFIYTLLLGMVIFQAMMLIISPIFPSGTTQDSSLAVDPETLQTNPKEGESEYNATSFGNPDIGSIVLGMIFNPVSVVIIGLFAVVGSGAGVVLGGVKNLPLAIGIGLSVGLTASLWNGTYLLISTLAQNNVYVNGIYTLITVCIGIIVVYMVAEMFMGQTQGVN